MSDAGMGPRFTPLIEALPATVPFVGPEAAERRHGRAFRARLGANESVFGPSPAAVEAMRAEAADAWKYGDPESWLLREALAARHGIDMGNLVVGAGIDGLLNSLVRLTVGPGNPVVTSLGAYPTFSYHVRGYGGQLHEVPYRDDFEDPDALAVRAHETRAKLVYLANPDNPMGGFHGRARVAALLDALPGDTLLVLDEAYADFAPNDDLLPVDTADPRLIRLRTFSKAHGLAGARVGYAIGARPLIAAFEKVRNHFGMSRVGQAGALAALSDTAWLDHVRAEVAAGKARIADIASENGLKSLPSHANFVAIDMGAGPELATAMVAALGEAGVFVRMPFAGPERRCIRVTAGRPADLDILAETFSPALDRARSVLVNGL